MASGSGPGAWVWGTPDKNPLAHPTCLPNHSMHVEHTTTLSVVPLVSLWSWHIDKLTRSLLPQVRLRCSSS